MPASFIHFPKSEENKTKRLNPKRINGNDKVSSIKISTTLFSGNLVLVSVYTVGKARKKTIPVEITAVKKLNFKENLFLLKVWLYEILSLHQ
jgi:hypothetical protein